MKTHLDMDKIAKGIGAERRRKVASSGGFLGAMQLLRTRRPIPLESRGPSAQRNWRQDGAGVGPRRKNRSLASLTSWGKGCDPFPVSERTPGKSRTCRGSMEREKGFEPCIPPDPN